MKILMFGHKTIPSREGGIEIVVGELATRFADKGHDVTVFNRKRKGTKIKQYNGVKIKTIFTINKKSLDAIVYSFFSTLKALFVKWDILHVHAEGQCCFLWLLRKSKKRKIIVTIHGLDWQRGKRGGFASKVLLFGEKQAVKHADEIIVLSRENQRYFKDTYGKETTLIPNGINEPNLMSANVIAKKWHLEKDDYVLFLARIVPEKGLEYLIDAWQSMTDEEKGGKKLVIAGGSSHTNEYFEFIKNKCINDSSIIMTGFVQGQTLEELYSNSYLYVLPSDVEGMPMSLLEALSYGNTCLVSNIDENKSVIRESDYTFIKSNVIDLKNKLIYIIGLNNKTHIDSYMPYLWDDVANRTLELYGEKNE